ncbi:putative protein kinase RLK-Pelle-DLSV family [Helianthus annuus]|uniref:Gnk2-like domain-containing protein n=1 Tax=Helianthus annuus TaxID=4232 RepID=A0A9K3IL05_HELAN|nr:putative protein kinase RLK-Pelle-DLSV family [Helianthus annuus]KAJ0549984.1 putative protein kinase RLK-Pelle-DLSV family [Helianthus annuus]KAJ0556563.1 putative protein kinase RLK-Pelle-DLSV family [Helianthus annuus]KAJ0562944.1 putative protein kinase RLK-Pelle-DLSV family [Helianthus annuus]KAJ0728310.1 putative protein kinase RLK-Pelle-DLSV family [Helianthus annuus]
MVYESISFYTETILPGVNPGICGNSTSSGRNVSKTAVDVFLSSLSIATPKINGLYAAATTSVVGNDTSIAYAIAQCAETLTTDECKSCLEVAYASISICASNDVIDGRAIESGCFMRYSTIPFFRSNQITDIAPFLRDGGSSNKIAIIGGVVGVVGGLIVLLIVVLWWYCRSKRTMPGGSLYGATELQGSKDYNYNDLKKATNDFGDENKLGEGGFGDVYKATFDDEKVVAVKKLKVRHAGAKIGFENEIQLISQIRHRNLLGLLGWCIDGSNLLLVLEYMPNGSLDRFLWGERKGTLSWKIRYDIILGIARGLAHLHKEVHVRIVHRDIKSSNILLDDALQPKIADFGFARFQPEDQSHVITKFVGTLGYTAPEYVRYGILSDKVDTFSFGIVVLEIISGQMCTSQNLDGPSTEFLLEHAWKLYENQKVVMLVDETMDINPDEEKHVKKIIEIALLCTQSPASERPAMSEVVLMLSSEQSSVERHLTRPNLPYLNRRIHIGSS